MSTKLRSLLTRLTAGASLGVVATSIAISPAWSQTSGASSAEKKSDAPKTSSADKSAAEKGPGSTAKSASSDKSSAKTGAKSPASPTTPGATKSSAATQNKILPGDTKPSTTTPAVPTPSASNGSSPAAPTRATNDAAADAARTTRDAVRETTRDATRSIPEDRRDPTTRSDRDFDRLSAPRSNQDANRRAITGDADTDRRSARDVARDHLPDADRADFRDADRLDADRRDARRASYNSHSFDARVDVNTFRAPDLGLWFDRSARDGLVIADVAATGPITRLGFREGDRIVQVHGHRVRSERDFVRYLFDEDLRDERVEVVVLRNGREQVIHVEPVVLLEEMHVAHHDPLEEIGIIVDDRYDDRVVVWKVLPRSPAYYAGVRPGDVIATWHGRRISRPDSFVQIVTQSDPGEVAIGVRRDNRVRDLQIEVPDLAAQSSRRTALRPNFNDRLEDRLERREERRELRDERREDRLENRLDAPYGPGVGPGADVNIDAPGAGVRIRRPATVPGTPGAGVQVETPAGDINIDANRGGGIVPRFRNPR